jgi:5-methylcytosine-specific restriction endonuclease McrA
MGFIDTYRHLLKRTKTLQRQIRERDNHCCQVPGCSRAAVHAHHIIPRSKGGTDDEWNLVSLCASHHLNGIHGGRIRVTGRAPDKLVWEFGLRRSHASTAVA